MTSQIVYQSLCGGRQSQGGADLNSKLCSLFHFSSKDMHICCTAASMTFADEFLAIQLTWQELPKQVSGMGRWQTSPQSCYLDLVILAYVSAGSQLTQHYCCCPGRRIHGDQPATDDCVFHAAGRWIIWIIMLVG
jgi:hypothetical protein